MVEYSPHSSLTLRIPSAMMNDLRNHLFPGDGDEHGAVIGATMISTSRGTRLLARRLYIAQDGVDYVPGQRGYRMLTANFVRDQVTACASEKLSYIAIHCHGGRTTVDFSSDDMASHERGYPALLDILDGPIVGGVVFASHAAAGDFWFSKTMRFKLEKVEIVGLNPETLYPSPPSRPPQADSTYDRQARLFGDRGQSILKNQKVVIIGAGGAGSLINEELARLGVGQLIVIDPKSIKPSNLSRIVGSRRSDVRPWITRSNLPKVLKKFGKNLRSSKVKIAERVAFQANPDIKFEGLQADITDPVIVEKILDADFIFLAADSMQARLVTNAIIHQYLIPGVQVGAKVQIEKATGDVVDVFSVVRDLVPGESCLWCNGLINPSQLAEEAASPKQRKNQRYVEEVAAPSVISLNAVAVSLAVNNYLFATTNLSEKTPIRWLKIHPLVRRIDQEIPRQDVNCPQCRTKVGIGPLVNLPIRSRAVPPDRIR